MMKTGNGARLAGMVLAIGLAFAAQGASAQTAPPVNAHQFAVDHPVPDVSLRLAPTLGASVPAQVQLAAIEGTKDYGYFYYEGRPVIVDMATRSIVRVD
ncbi:MULTISPECIES: DUF1236 domain-containing protein [unclassified Aureimonas]|uniref:DUF1236 domain-containing protein n=1 Tax=unclassified Aureimonas TaxID=2615206 RepID=UPI00072278F0|nr:MULTISPECIES: DUF1236 domain-containing protein [unclassified Aureimonas]ALN71288.1 hypothetical protein M673_01100 [Aureimonas sp. AU20]